GDMMLGANQIKYFAEMAEKVPLLEEIQVPQFPAQSKNYLQHEPIGVCGQIIPWNFPLMMAVWKIGPALCTGNTLVLKPASDTPCSALELAKIIDQTDLPKGVVTVVHGSGAECGEELCTRPLVDKVARTWSSAPASSPSATGWTSGRRRVRSAPRASARRCSATSRRAWTRARRSPSAASARSTSPRATTSSPPFSST